MSALATRLASARSSNASPTASLTQVQMLKTSRPFARFAPASAAAATMILKNSLRVLASTQDLVCVSKTARAPPQKGASIYKDYSRVVKVEPTVAMRKKTPARPRREEPVVTLCQLGSINLLLNSQKSLKKLVPITYPSFSATIVSPLTSFGLYVSYIVSQNSTWTLESNLPKRTSGD